jgi:predicted RNA-binding protein with PIN domain
VLSCWALKGNEPAPLEKKDPPQSKLPGMVKSAILVILVRRMPYLVDGHNLIPKLGLRLDSFDDELNLLARLQEFCRLRRVELEVYFDGAPPGQASTRMSGVVTAHFIRRGSSADAAIEARLTSMKKSAKNWTVVSSDKRLQNAAAAAHAGYISAEEFASQMSKARLKQVGMSGGESVLSPGEVDEWLKFFEKRGG